jgi:hypothetical protein
MKYFVFNEFENIYTDDFQEAKDWYNSHVGSRIFEKGLYDNYWEIFID